MSEPINFIVTNTGKNALYAAQQLSTKLSLTKIGLGSGQYTPVNTRTAMASKFTDNGISAGSIEKESFALRFTVIMNFAVEKLVSELGLYTSAGVLFAVASKPAGSFFRLYPGIDYVATFGLVVEKTIDPSQINFTLDGRGALAIKMMGEHTAATDPHPQYKEYSQSIFTGHLLAEDPHPQYAKKTLVAEEVQKMNDKIASLVGITEYLFPPVIEGGYGNGATLVARRRNGASYSWMNRSIVHLYCPESSNEAWDTVREANQFTTTAYERSGTSRIGYSGRANYIIIDNERVLTKRGFIPKTNQLANEIKSGVFEVGEKLIIQREASETLDYTSDKVAVLISPEGGHEAWEITRTKDQISINVFNRSGTNRIGYSGRVNWSLFKANAAPLNRDKYPFNLISGVNTGASFTIPAPAGFDFTNPNYVPIISPESLHEGWTITRTAAGFKVDVNSRSGTNRIGYSGKVSWAVFMLVGMTNQTILGPGNHNFKFKPGYQYRITAVGGGGAGGNAIYYHSGATALASENGGDSIITMGNFVITSEGGKGGIRGCWNNGSAYRNGANGAGGKFTYTNAATNGLTGFKAEYENGTAGTMASYDAGAGGLALYGQEYAKGSGGKGKSGSGSRSEGFGGSGGGAASGIVSFKVGQNIDAKISVGKAGNYYNDPAEYYQSQWHYGFGAAGQAGVVIIEESTI